MIQDYLSIIILIHNDQRWIKKCFDSLYSQTYKNFEVIVINNASSDDSANYIRKNYLQVKIIESSENLGFTGGNNLGIQNAQGEYILLLNPDTWMKEDFLEKFFSFFKHNDYAAISPLEGNYEREEIKNKNFSSKIDPLGQTILLPQKTGARDHFNVCGFCFLFRKALYEETGGLDNDFFIYIEEVDWCWRLRLLGYQVTIVEDLCVYHSGGATGPWRYFVFSCRNRNIPQMLLKNYAWYNLLWVLPLYFFQNILEMFFFLAIGYPQLSWSYLSSWIFVAKKLPSIIKKRKWVQSKRKVSDREIMKKYFYWGNAKLVQLLNFYKK